MLASASFYKPEEHVSDADDTRDLHKAAKDVLLEVADHATAPDAHQLLALSTF